MILGIRGIEESSVSQAILAEGKAKGRSEEAQQMLLRLGAARFGTPGAKVVAAIKAMTEVVQIEAVADRLFTEIGWDDLLGR